VYALEAFQGSEIYRRFSSRETDAPADGHFEGGVSIALRASHFGLPAAHGGAPLFPEGLQLVRPVVKDQDEVIGRIQSSLHSGVLTNGPYVAELEARAAAYLGVRHCVAVASCTAGLMLVLRASELAGDVVLPSFTFSATAHAVAWNGLRPTFADIDPNTLTISADSAASITGGRTSAILATHTYGIPCDVEGLTRATRRSGVRLFFDAAHAFGARYQGANVGGFGDAEIFSLSPTKLLIAGEGGIIATNEDILAERCRIGRDYGNPGNYDCILVGINARMSEMHAAIALSSLDHIEEEITRRNDLAQVYKDALAGIPGISTPSIRPGDRCTYKDFTVLVEPEEFGTDAASLSKLLEAEGIQTRRYFSPPVHTMRSYRSMALRNGNLQVTNAVSQRVLTLPMWGGLEEEEARLVARAIERIQDYYGASIGRTELVGQSSAI
jgi:dTDP-4-amino-4,6-dideoxygalactose transaminase